MFFSELKQHTLGYYICFSKCFSSLRGSCLYMYASMRLLRLESVCSTEHQQLQRSTLKVHADYSVCMGMCSLEL